MADETKRSISELPTQATSATGDLIEVAIVNQNSQTGYSSYKESLAAIADAIAGNFQYPLLLTQTTAKTLAGAINELAQGGGGHTYSTTEQVVGTWIDGKPLYQKTVVFGDVSSSSGNIDLSTGLNNIEKIFVDKSASQIADGYALPNVHYSTSNIVGYLFDMNSGSPILCIRAGDGMKQYLSNTIVTFRYTKTTDTV